MPSSYPQRLAAEFRALVAKNASVDELEAFLVRVTRESFIKGLKYGQPAGKPDASSQSSK